MAKVGVYDLRIHHDQVVLPVQSTHWNIDRLTGLSDEAERAPRHSTLGGRLSAAMDQPKAVRAVPPLRGTCTGWRSAGFTLPVATRSRSTLAGAAPTGAA